MIYSCFITYWGTMQQYYSYLRVFCLPSCWCHQWNKHQQHSRASLWWHIMVWCCLVSWEIQASSSSGLGGTRSKMTFSPSSQQTHCWRKGKRLQKLVVNKGFWKELGAFIISSHNARLVDFVRDSSVSFLPLFSDVLFTALTLLCVCSQCLYWSCDHICYILYFTALP